MPLPENFTDSFLRRNLRVYFLCKCFSLIEGTNFTCIWEFFSLFYTEIVFMEQQFLIFLLGNPQKYIVQPPKQ